MVWVSNDRTEARLDKGNSTDRNCELMKKKSGIKKMATKNSIPLAYILVVMRKLRWGPSTYRVILKSNIFGVTAMYHNIFFISNISSPQSGLLFHLPSTFFNHFRYTLNFYNYPPSSYFPLRDVCMVPH